MKELEYASLREELLYLKKVKDNMYIAVAAICGSIFTYLGSSRVDNPYYYLIPLIIIIPSAYKHIGVKASMIRIGSYIEVVHERGSRELYWERCIDNILFEPNSMISKFHQKLRRIHSLFYPIIGACTLWPFINLQLSKSLSLMDIVVSVSIVIIVIGLLVNIYSTLKEAKLRRSQYKQEFEVIYGQLSQG